jgi:alpha,alpha-trehalase
VQSRGESGIKFSSRWLINEQVGSIESLKNLKTRSIIAVELNAILHWNAKIIAESYGRAGNDVKRMEFETKAQVILEVSAPTRIELYRLLIKLSLIAQGRRRSPLG